MMMIGTLGKTLRGKMEQMVSAVQSHQEDAQRWGHGGHREYHPQAQQHQQQDGVGTRDRFGRGGGDSSSMCVQSQWGGAREEEIAPLSMQQQHLRHA